MAYDLRNAHFRDPATIMRGMDVAGRLLAVGRLDLEPLVTMTEETAPTSGAQA